MQKPFGRAQKAILAVATFPFVTSTVLTTVGCLSGDNWVTFNIAIILATLTALSGGKVLQKRFGGDDE